MQGFLNLNKPAGFTSHDCVAKVRRLLHLKRVGHGGTLDPAATGVLPIALGRATRLLQFLQGDKAYRATIRFGLRTATDDLEGEILETAPVPWLDLEQIQQVLPTFQGTIQQIPPRYSAIQVGGKRLYDLARAGETFDVPIRSVEIYAIEIVDWRSGDFPELELDITCGTGTYIRAIARDLGDILNTGATLASLIRTASSGFCLAESLTLDDLANQLQAESFHPIQPDVALHHLPQITLATQEATRWCQGQRLVIEPPSAEASPSYRIYGEDGRFLGMSQASDVDGKTLLQPDVVFPVEEPASKNSAG